MGIVNFDIHCYAVVGFKQQLAYPKKITGCKSEPKSLLARPTEVFVCFYHDDTIGQAPFTGTRKFIYVQKLMHKDKTLNLVRGVAFLVFVCAGSFFSFAIYLTKMQTE